MRFKEKVYNIVANIPKGKVATYQQVAGLAGSHGAARAVGSAMRTNIDQNTVPCHRVVGSDGKMHGYNNKNGIARKREILEKEGVVFRDQAVDLSVSLWNPDENN